MGTSSARPDDLDDFVAGSRAADDELRTLDGRVRSAYGDFQAGTRWGHFDASSLIAAFGRYIELNEADARWVAQIAAAFRTAGGDGDLSRLPDAAIEASLRAAGLGGGRDSVTFDSPVAFGFPATTGYADDPVNTASGNFLIAEAELPVAGLAAGLTVRRVYNSRSDRVGAFGPGWSCWADARLHAREDGAEYTGPDGQRALFPRQGAGYGRVLGVQALVHPTTAGLELRWFDGRVWEFDGSGRPVRIDGRIDFAYDGARLGRMTDRGGRSVDVVWTGDRITAVAGSDGRRVEYGYAGGALTTAGGRRYEVDEGARVVAVTDADGVVEARNTYDAAGRVLTQLSRFGRRTRFVYLPGRVTVTMGEEEDSPANTYAHDSQGRLLTVVDGHGQRLGRTYDEWGNPVSLTERNGAVETTEWDEWCRPIRRVLPGGAAFRYRYDDAGRVTAVTAESGGAIAYRYDGAERTPSEVVDAEGGVTRLEVRDGLVHRVTDPDGVVLTIGFDDDGALVSTTDALGNTARLERDTAGRAVAAITPMGRRSTLRYDAHGWLAARRGPDGATWRYEHTAAGRRTAVIDPAGARREIRYGGHGDVEATVDPLGNTDLRHYDQSGNVTRVIAPGGAKWDYGYDALSRLISTTDPAGATWLREYDVAGNLVGTVDPVGTRYSATVDPAGRVTGLDDGVTSASFEYDPLGRAVAQVRPDGTTTRAGYDRCGRRVTIEDPSGGLTRIEYTPAGRVRRAVSPTGHATLFEYDACGRLAARIDGAGRRWSYRYDADGAMIEQIEPDGGRETFDYDAAGRLVRRSAPGAGVSTTAYDPAGRPVTVTDRMTGTRHFRYDRAGRLTAATDGLGNTTRYGYNDRGWPITVTDPEGGATTRRYDEVGRLTAETDPLGRTTTVEYDAAGRVIGRVDGSGARVRWTRDASGRIRSAAWEGSTITIERDALGRVVAVDEPGAPRIEQGWDAAGRLVRRRRGDLGLTWSYDVDGNRSALGYPDGTRTEYEHDGAGLVSAVRDPVRGEITLARDPAGRLTHASGAGFQARWSYENGELVRYRLGDRDTVLGRDATGRVVAVTENDQTHRFAYDAAGQLRSADDVGFQYDRNGRLVRETSPRGAAEYAYDPAGQLVSRRASAAVTGYEYDGAGRRTAQHGPDVRIGYRWDGLGRLTEIDTRPTGGAERRTAVAVDGLGELAEVGGVPVLWDSADPLGPPCWLAGRPVPGAGTPRAGAPGDEADWRGTVGAAGRDVWGAPAHHGEAALGFRGEVEFDGHVWMRDRVYAPDTRSFLQPDPLEPVPGSAAAANPYHYAGNDPVGMADPLGRRPVTDEELRGYRDQMGRNAWEATTDWVGDNWEYLLAGAMIVGGVALMFTGVGGPAGIALLAGSGALISGGVSMGVQKYTTGTVDPAQLGTDMLIGAVSGGAGGAAGMLVGGSRLLAGASPLLRNAVTGGVSGVAGGATARAASGEDPFDPQGIALDLLIGGGAGAVGGRLGARARARNEGGWTLPEAGGGAKIGGRWYTEHALERMAPDTPQVRALLESRALARAQAEGLVPGTKDFGQWWGKHGPSPRNIPPSVVEAEIANPGSTGVRVITNSNGDVVTVIPQ